MSRAYRTFSESINRGQKPTAGTRSSRNSQIKKLRRFSEGISEFREVPASYASIASLGVTAEQLSSLYEKISSGKLNVQTKQRLINLYSNAKRGFDAYQKVKEVFNTNLSALKDDSTQNPGRIMGEIRFNQRDALSYIGQTEDNLNKANQLLLKTS